LLTEKHKGVIFLLRTEFSEDTIGDSVASLSPKPNVVGILEIVHRMEECIRCKKPAQYSDFLKAQEKLNDMQGGELVDVFKEGVFKRLDGILKQSRELENSRSMTNVAIRLSKPAPEKLALQLGHSRNRFNVR
jgi:hypothetical protein